MNRHGRPGDGQYRLRGMDQTGCGLGCPIAPATPSTPPTAAATVAAPVLT